MAEAAARWAKFRPTDARIGVRYNDATAFVPQAFGDRMNSVAFYISYYGIRRGIKATDTGYSMSRSRYDHLVRLVDDRVVGEPIYSDRDETMTTDQIVTTIGVLERRLESLRTILATR